MTIWSGSTLYHRAALTASDGRFFLLNGDRINGRVDIPTDWSRWGFAYFREEQSYPRRKSYWQFSCPCWAVMALFGAPPVFALLVSARADSQVRPVCCGEMSHLRIDSLAALVVIVVVAVLIPIYFKQKRARQERERRGFPVERKDRLE